MSHILLPVRLCIQTLDVYCPTSKLSQYSLAAAHVMEERKQAASFSFGWTRENILLHSQTLQAVSSFHGVTLPWNQRTLSSLHLAEETNAALPRDCKGGREGGRGRSLVPSLFLPHPNFVLQPDARWPYAVTCVDLKITRQKVDGPFFSPPVYGTPVGFPGCSRYRLTSNRSEETERLFTCQPQSSGCVVSPAAVDDSLTP